MNWLGFCACIAAWVVFELNEQTASANVAIVSAIICSWMDGGPIVRASFKSNDKKDKPE